MPPARAAPQQRHQHPQVLPLGVGELGEVPLAQHLGVGCAGATAMPRPQQLAGKSQS